MTEVVEDEITECIFSPKFCWVSVSGDGFCGVCCSVIDNGLSSACGCLVSEEFSFSDMRGSARVVVNTVVAIELLLDTVTYFGSISIFLSVLELGSMSDALVSGGNGGFPVGVPRAVTVGAEEATIVT